MPELPVKDLRVPELHLPEINRDDIVRTLSERLPSVNLSSVELPKLDRGTGRGFDWRSIDVTEALAGVAALTRLARPLTRRPRLMLAVGVVAAIGVATAAVLANPVVRERAGRTVGKLRDKAQARMERSDVLEIEHDVDPPSAGELVTDDAPLPAAEEAEGGTSIGDIPAGTADVQDEAARPV
jgi:hypothetical protein